MSCECNKNGSNSSTPALKLFGGRRRKNSRSKTRKGVQKRRRRKSRAMRGGDLKSLFNISSGVSQGVHPASQKFGLGSSYMV